MIHYMGIAKRSEIGRLRLLWMRIKSWLFYGNIPIVFDEDFEKQQGYYKIGTWR